MTLSRRDAVRSLALGAGGLVLPGAHRVFAQPRETSGRPPTRFVFVLQSNGFHPWAAQPQGLDRTEQGPDRPVMETLRDFEFTEDLSPLEPVKHRTTIIQRLNGAHTGPWHSALFAALAGTRRQKYDRPAPKDSKVTVDAALALALPAKVPIVHLGIENSEDDEETDGKRLEHVKRCGAWGPNRPIRTTLEPSVAYGELFGPGSPGADIASFDFIRDEAVRDRVRPKLDDRYGSSLEAQRLEAQFELATAALVGGLTNVATIVSGACNTNGYFEGLKVDGLDFTDLHLHSVGHFRPREAWKRVYTALRKYHFQLIVDLYRKLESVPEGNGTMMDNTCIVYTSDGADTHHSKGHEWPFVIIGGLQNRLRTDAFIEYPAYGRPGNRTINALYCTLLNAAGVECDHFNLTGDLAKLDRHGPLDELLR